MRCPTCLEQNRKHSVYEGMVTRTLMFHKPGYWDENDQWVENPDPNTETVSYSCSNGHKWDLITCMGKTTTKRDFGWAVRSKTFNTPINATQ